MAPKAKKNLKASFDAVADPAPPAPEPASPVVEPKPAPKAPKAPKKPAKADSDEDKPAKDCSGDEAPAKPKSTRKPSNYNLLLGEFMRKIALQEKEKPEEDRIPRGERMKAAQAMYREWKAARA